MKYINLVLSLAGIFLLGAYTFSHIYCVKEVSLLQWIITPFFSLYFLGLFINDMKKVNKS